MICTLKHTTMLAIASLCLFSSSCFASDIDAPSHFRYAYSADGFNQDRDDVAGSAMAIALFDKAGLSDRIVHFHFNTNFGGQPTHADEHRKSVLQTAVLFGIIKSENADDEFFDAAKQREAAIVHLATQMTLATRAEPLMMICAGGVQVPYAALHRAIDQGANEDALGSITFLSHGKENEITKRAKHTNPEYRVNWDDLRKLSPTSRFIDHSSALVNGSRAGGVIPSQNSTAWNQSPRSKHQGLKPWLWLSKYGETVEGFGFKGTKGEWLLTRLKAAGAPEIGHNGNAEGDASDAGMVFAVLPAGLTDPNMNEIKSFFMTQQETTTEQIALANDEQPVGAPPTPGNNWEPSKRQTDKVFDEVGGTVIMEMESTLSPLGDWKKRTSLQPMTGDCYLEFTGNNPGVGPPTSPLKYTFRINSPGNYWISLRTHKRLTGDDGVTARSDMCNDCYVRVEGDYESGDAKLPLSWLKKDMKFWGNAADLDWKNWSNKVVGDHDAIRTVRYQFKAGQLYTLVVSGRAQRFSVDRIVVTRNEEQRLNDADPESNLVNLK